MDDYDYRIIRILNDDGRISINKLAEEINDEGEISEIITESSIYHRFYKLKNKKIIEKFSISLSKDLNLFRHIFLLFIRTQKDNSETFSMSLMKSVARFLEEEFSNIFFSSVCEDFGNIIAISACDSYEEFKRIKSKLESNDFITDIVVYNIENLIKGEKLFYIKEDLSLGDKKKSFFE